jgi:hypothetical protein
MSMDSTFSNTLNFRNLKSTTIHNNNSNIMRDSLIKIVLIHRKCIANKKTNIKQNMNNTKKGC